MPRRMKPGDETEHRVFYCPEAAGAISEISGEFPVVTLSGEEAHHAIHVLRVRVGESVRLFDGLGAFYNGRVADIAKKSISIAIENRIESQAEPCARLILMVGLLKGRALDFLIQKSVEIGVSDLVLFQADRSVARMSRGGEESNDRCENQVVSACKQCGRARLMDVRAIGSLEEALASIPEKSSRYVFWEDFEAGEEPAPVRLGEVRSSSAICAMIGPEGSFTPGEIELIRSAGFVPCSLGPRVLRSETAALAAAALLLYQAGDLGRLADYHG